MSKEYIKCPKCDFYMPPEYDRCDDCLLKEYYELLGNGKYDSLDSPGFNRLFDEEKVLIVIRKAEKKHLVIPEKSTTFSFSSGIKDKK